MRHLQLKRSEHIYENSELALNALKEQEKATYRSTAADTSRVLFDGEPIIASYKDEKAPNGVADIIGFLIKTKDKDGVEFDKLFYIDSQDIINKIGFEKDKVLNDLWKQFRKTNKKEPIVINGDETTTVIDAINSIAEYIVSLSGDSDQKFNDLQAELDRTQVLTVGYNSTKESEAPFSALEKSVITSGSTSLIDAIKKIDDTIIEDEKVTAASLNDLNTRVIALSGKTLTELEDTQTIDFIVKGKEDGTLKAEGNVKVSRDVKGNLLKTSGDTGLYVSTDDIQKVAGAVDEITKTTGHTKFATSANTFTVSYANGKPDVIHQITYDSAMPDTLTTPSKHGGIESGTSAQTLNGKSISKILDMILFPEIFPTLNNYSVGITPGAVAVEVGTKFQTYTVTTNRGKVTCPGQPDKWQLGKAKKTAPYTGTTANAAHTTEAETLPATVGYGTIYVRGYAEFEQGDELTTSYGNKATKDVNGKNITNPQPAQNLVGGASAVRGFYKYGSNGNNIDSIVKASAEATNNKGGNVVKNGNTTYGSALIVEYKSAEKVMAGGLVTDNGGFVLALPKALNAKMKDILQFNAGSGAWDASVMKDWEEYTTGDKTKFPGTLTDAAGKTYDVVYYKHKDGSAALDGSGAARVSFAFVW